MPTTQTKYFGELSYTPDTVLSFPAGLLGFEEYGQFLLLEQPDSSPLCFLQSLEDPALCFLAMPATQVDPGFQVFLDRETCCLLDLAVQEEPYAAGTLLCLAIVNFDGNGSRASANLLGPVVIHVASRKAAQVVQYESDYDLKHPVAPLDEVLAC